MSAQTTRSEACRGRRSDAAVLGLVLVLVLAAVVSLLALLRDPSWLDQYSSGLRAWETAADGARMRWAAPHASFFVPSGARAVRLRLRTTFDQPGDWPVRVSVTLDDVAVERVVLVDPDWRDIAIRLPPPGGRHVRRIDLRADRTRDGNRAFQLGEVIVEQGR